MCCALALVASQTLSMPPVSFISKFRPKFSAETEICDRVSVSANFGFRPNFGLNFRFRLPTKSHLDPNAAHELLSGHVKVV